SILRGADFSVSVEEVTTRMNIRFDPAKNEVQLSPEAGKASAIVRFTHRFRETSESVSYAVRLRNIAAGRPAGARPVVDRRAISVSSGDDPLQMDIEVTHTDRRGQCRIFECDDLAAPRELLPLFRSKTSRCSIRQERPRLS
ncbi:MAG: hypothetical protein ACREBC_31745, partial [Pyrinomonadaceae bacterium]